MRKLGCVLILLVVMAVAGVAILREMLITAVLSNNSSVTATRIVTVLPFLVDTKYDNGVLKIPMLNGAVVARNKATISALVSRGAIIDARNHAKETPIMLAAQWGHIDVIRLLLANGANVNARDCIGRTPLHHGIDYKNVSAISALLQAGADPNAEDNNGSTPVMMAVDIGNKSLVSLLRKHGADDPVTIFEAVAFGDTVTVRKLLNADPSILEAKGMRKMSPLDYAARHGQPDIVRLLLSKGARVSKLVVSLGADSGSIDVVSQLLAHGGNINPNVGTSEATPLYCAINNGDLAMVHYLVEKGADVHAEAIGKTPLRLAQETGHKEIIAYLKKCSVFRELVPETSQGRDRSD